MNDIFDEWNKFLDELESSERELKTLKKEYLEKSQEIISNTDFKELYGRNNESVRKDHVNKELSELVEKIDELKLLISDRVRRIEYFKAIAHYDAMVNGGIN